ncbi:hypothetical protein JQC91_13350 [Jannaschia sp. Os4]|uniref:hypothetical protein n=1 Tax=Jannaschia sp. Os4 TaxID=2807617 RepID=UPI00193A1223|nr:hypothetical protein [Jannaschia sp. Os4]MBM2577289.1 hypothetical protein [Jannaschia sp. Os4]
MTPIRAWGAWLAAAALGLVAAWAAFVLTGQTMLTRPTAGSFVMQVVAVPMGALAAFAVVWTLATGRVLRGRFWLWGTLVVMAAWFGAIAAAFLLRIDVPAAIALGGALALAISTRLPLRAAR